MSVSTKGSTGAAGRFQGVRTFLDHTQVAGRPVSWYLTGWRGGLIVLFLAILFPWIVADQSLIQTGIAICVYVLLALGLNIVVGYAGLLDLGYVAFFVIGSYTTAVLTSGFVADAKGVPHTFTPTSFWLVLPIAALVAGFFGVLLGAPTLRLRGDYLAIVTLGFGEIVPIFFNNVPYFFAQFGIQATQPADIGPISFQSATDNSPIYYLALSLVVLVILGVISLRESSLGRAWIAIREDETAAAASGINLVRTKLLAFGLGAFVGGVGGALNTVFVPAINPSEFNFGISITVLVMIVLGGLGSIPGVILGAVILKLFDFYLLGRLNDIVHASPLVTEPGAPFHFLAAFDLGTTKFLIYGVVLVTIILLRPQGLIPNVRRQRELKGIGASVEGASAVGLLEREEAGLLEPSAEEDEQSAFTGAGSDAQGRDS